MRCARWVFASSILTALGACSLTTSLGGLSGGDVIAANGPSDGDAPDAMMNDGRTETGTSTEAGAEGGANAYRAVVLADAPLAYYRLDDQGMTAKDEVGAHDGVYKGTVTHGAGAIAGDTNRAATFDGMTGYVDIGDVLAFTNDAPFTIEAWASPVNGATDPACIASKSFASGGVGGNISEGYTVYLRQDGNTVTVARYRSGVDDTISGPSVTSGTFTHVVATYDGATIAIWIDGVSVASGASTRALVSTTQPLTIGASRGGIYCYFRGALDEVAIYGKALAGGTIRAHHAAGLGN